MESVQYTFEDNYGHKHYLTEEISRGGQGAVYRTTDANIAVKLSLDNNNPVMDASGNDAYNKIRLLPFAKKLNLTLPRAVLKDASGYVMDLLGDMNSFSKLFNTERYEPMKNNWLEGIAAANPRCADDLGRYAESGGSRRRLELYLGFAGTLAKLHCSGLVFCDVSSNNVFGSTDFSKRNVWLIDSDNVNYQAITIRGKSAYYTPGYAAPEVLDAGECSMYSDSYAFAVSLFWDLTLNHPFMGKRYDEICDEQFVENAQEWAFSGEGSWILDSDDDSNSADTTIPVSIILTDGLMGCFQRMFSERGRTEVLTRPTMPELGMHIAKTLDKTVTCCNCGMGGVLHSGRCQWCDNTEEVLRLSSYLTHDDRKTAPLWECDTVLSSQGMSVPFRLVEGYRPDNTDKIVFRCSYKNGDVLISDICNDADMYILQDGEKPRKVYGSYLTSADEFKIMLRMIAGNTNIIIEGRRLK